MLERYKPRYMAHMRPTDNNDMYRILSDEQVENEVLKGKCPSCGGKLHKASQQSHASHYKCNSCKTEIVAEEL